MKNIFKIAIIMLSAVFFSCTGGKTEAMQQRIDSLNVVVSRQQQEMADMTHTLDVVAEGIDSIHRQEHIIYTGVDEVTGKKLTRKEIRQCIKELEILLKRQRERIVQLEDSLSTNNDKRIAGLKSIIAQLNRQLEEKQRTIDQLENKVRNQHNDIQNLTADVSRLSKDNEQLTEHVEMQETALAAQSDIINEGYYIIGTRKELKAAGVIEVNLLQQSKVNLETADLSRLEKIDIRTFSDEMTIDAKKVKILSHMPEQSYALVKQDGKVKLYIKDPAQFWSMSKILVIQKQ